jgi:hypothetical protein
VKHIIVTEGPLDGELRHHVYRCEPNGRRLVARFASWTHACDFRKVVSDADPLRSAVFFRNSGCNPSP